MKAYHDLLTDVLENGEERDDRTGTGTLSVFGRQARFDLREGFPCLTTKKLHLRSIIHELLWFLKGGTNIGYLRENRVTIWDEWADENGDLGPVYGKQWRAWETPDGRVVDQIALLVHGLTTDPRSRRHIVSAWNAGEVGRMALPPCHLLFQFYVHQPREEGGRGPAFRASFTNAARIFFSGSLSTSPLTRCSRISSPASAATSRVISSIHSAISTLQKPPGTSPPATHPRSAAAAHPAPQSRGERHRRLRL